MTHRFMTFLLLAMISAGAVAAQPPRGNAHRVEHLGYEGVGTGRHDQAGLSPGFCNSLLRTVPANVEGTWRLKDGELKLRQKFQMLTGALALGQQTVPIADARLCDDRIEFEAGGTRYAGHVSRSAMSSRWSGRGSGARSREAPFR